MSKCMKCGSDKGKGTYCDDCRATIPDSPRQDGETKRKPIQISVSVYQGICLVALCEDGTIWMCEKPYHGDRAEWLQVAGIPS